MPEGDIRDLLTDIYKGYSEFTYIDDNKDIEMIIDAEVLWQAIEGEIKTPLGTVRGKDTENYGCRLWSLIGTNLNNLSLKTAKYYVEEVSHHYPNEVYSFPVIDVIAPTRDTLEIRIVVDSIYGKFTGVTHLKQGEQPYYPSRDGPLSSRLPDWWREDLLVKTLDSYIEDIEYEYLFDILSNRVEQPIQVWKEALMEEEPTIINDKTDKLEDFIINLPVPMYKNKGRIIIDIDKGHIDNKITEIKIENKDQEVIVKDINLKAKKIICDLNNEALYIDNKVILDNIPFKYFESEYDEKNETIFKNKIELKITVKEDLISKFNNIYNITVEMDKTVFMIEQNVKVSTFAFLPLKSIELYGLYDLEHNKEENGWKYLWRKDYTHDEHVMSDMITVQYPVEKFYANVEFYGLSKVVSIGFPQELEPEIPKFRLNPNLDRKGAELGLPRRTWFKKEIPYEKHNKTLPVHYPYDIEQDYWYERRLMNEYIYKEEPENSTILKDEDDTSLIRLDSKDPFVRELVVVADTKEPNYDIYFTETEKILPKELIEIKNNKNTEWNRLGNILRDDDTFATTTMRVKKGQYITDESYKTTTIQSFFDLSFLPEDIRIAGLEFFVDTRSNNSYVNKKDDERTMLIMNDFNPLETFENTTIPIKINNEYHTEYFYQENKLEFRTTEDIIIDTIFEEASSETIDIYVNNYLRTNYNVKNDGKIIYNLGKLKPGIYTYYLLYNYKGDETTNAKQLLNTVTIVVNNDLIKVPCEQNEVWTKQRNIIRYGGDNDLFKQSKITREQLIDKDFSFVLGLSNDDILDENIINIFNIKMKVYYRKILPMFNIKSALEKSTIEENEETNLIIKVKNTGEVPLTDQKINIMTTNSISVNPEELPLPLLNPKEELEFIGKVTGIKQGYWGIYAFIKNKVAQTYIKVISDG